MLQPALISLKDELFISAPWTVLWVAGCDLLCSSRCWRCSCSRNIICCSFWIESILATTLSHLAFLVPEMIFTNHWSLAYGPWDSLLWPRVHFYLVLDIKTLPGQVIKSGSFSCGREIAGATDKRLSFFGFVFVRVIAGEPWIELYLETFSDPLWFFQKYPNRRSEG